MRTAQSTRLADDDEALNRLAAALENECAAWRLEITEDPKYPSREYTLRQQEEKRRRNVLWENAVSVGRLLCDLRDVGVFDDELRIKNAIGAVQAELAKARRENKPPIYYFVVNVPYSPESAENSYDAFYVKTFESYCKIAARSPEDHRAFQQYYVQPQEKAAFHIKMMRRLSHALKERCRV